MSSERIAALGRGLCIAGAAVGGIGLLRWIAGAPALTGTLPTQWTMMPNTGACLLLAGIAGALLQHRDGARRFVALVAAGVVLGVATATLVQYALGVDLHIDELLVRTGVGPHPGRMSPPTALAFVFAAGALLLFDSRPASRFRPSEWLAMAAWFLAFTAALAHVFRVGPLYHIEDEAVKGVSAPTAIGMLLVAAGLLLERPATGIMRVVTSSGPGGVLLRRLSVAAILGPVVANLTLSWLLELYGVRQLPVVYVLLGVTAAVLSVALLTATAIPLERAHEALASSRARTRMLFEQAPEAIFIADANGRYVEVNAAASRLLGYTQDELIGMQIVDLLRAEDLAAFEAHRARIFAGATEVGEWTVRRKDGSTVIVEVGTKLLGDGRWQAFVRDVSERKRAEEAIRLSQARFSGIVAISPDAIMSIDDDQRITLFNEGAERIFGWSSEEVIGAPLDVLIPERLRAVHREHVREFAAEPVTSRPMGALRPIIGLRKNGEEFPAEAAISKLDVGGKRLYTVSLRDVSQQRRVERETGFLADLGAALGSIVELDEALRRFCRLVVRQLAEVVVVRVFARGDEPARLRVVARDSSKAWACDLLQRLHILEGSWTGLTAPAITTRRASLEKHDSPEDFAVTDEDRRALRALDIRRVASAPLLIGDELIGAVAFASPTALWPWDERGVRFVQEVAGRLALALEYARLYRATQLAVRDRDDVLGVVVHDLRNPLSTILLQAKLLSLVGSREAPACKAGAVIERAASRMTRLVEDLLDVTRMEAGRVPLERVRVSPAELVANAVDAQQALAASRSLELRVDVAPGTPDVWGDHHRLLQVLDNLVGNALKFTNPGGRIIVGSAPRERDILFWVADTGVGIQPSDVPHVFDRFWQARKAKRAGAGLGLPIVKGLVEAHGGRVWLKSALGRGTTFFFTVPRAEAADQRHVEPSGPRGV